MQSNLFEAQMALSSITQNAGFSGLREISENTNPGATESLIKTDDGKDHTGNLYFVADGLSSGISRHCYDK